MLRNTLVAAMMLAFCGSASAAGLGRINVLSSLGQPLRAEVELTASADELDNMVVRVASPEAYRRANVEFLNTLSGVKMSVERRGTGAVVRITSDKPFSEPFVDLLIDLNWAGGRLQREYTFLLDPADMSGPKPVAAIAPPVSRAPESRLESRPIAEPMPAAQARAETAPAPTASVVRERAAKPQSTGEDYAVKRGDNLSKIASELNSGEVTQEQMVAALYRSNSEAFVGGNINRLRAGRILKVPQAGEVVQIPKAEARRIILKASNFEQYRQTVASAAVAAPARDAGVGQAASGKIAPKVEEKAAPAQQTQDKVKVTAAETGKPGATVATDAATKARLQTLQDDIASREKALKEANSRVGDLEKNVKELQKLIELKSQGLADAQKQASVAQSAAKAAESRADKAEKAKADQDKKSSKLDLASQSKPAVVEAAVPAPVAEVSAPVVEQSISAAAPVVEISSTPAVVEQSVVAPAVAASSVAAVPAPAPVEEEGGLFRNLGVVLGLGVVAAGIGYVVLKQRRKQAAAGTGNTQMTDASTTTSPNSVFGSAGGQTVDTGGTSLLHTDFSQSGMSAIDADEGVDPVAEADVYMAYGRDAQAEEILLDALKNDPSRTAVYVKLLEIYAQRRSLKQFENIATDLYTQTAGVGDDWSKAAALGVKLDPNNPLYKSTAVEQKVPAEVKQQVVEAPVAVPEIPGLEETPAVSFGTNNISQVRSTWTVPGEIGQFTTGEGNVPMLPEAAPVVTPVPEALNLDFNLDLDSPSIDDQPTQVESREDKELLPSMDEAIATQPSIIDEEAPLEFDIGLDDADTKSATTAGIDTPHRAETTETDFDIGIETDSDREVLSEVDLEKTNFEGSLLDFDFELGDEAEKPALDLSNVNLHTTGTAEPVTTIVRPAAVSMEPIQDSIDVNDEVSTKLELAKAYEEMGDMEGARELLEEVISDGADFQKDQAKTMLGRLGCESSDGVCVA